MTAQYPALPSSSSRDYIRLLELHPGRLESQLKGQLIVTPLESAPPYEGLSYVWGDPAPVGGLLLIDGGSVPIAHNLYRALQRLRYRCRLRRLWVDAICIDQASVEEKTSQVALMGKIYSNAARALIWLGDSVHRTQTDWALIWRTIRDPIKDAGYDPPVTAARTLTSWRSHPRWSCIAVWDACRNHVALLSEILPNDISSWADRKWTVQEFLLARKRALCFGSRTMRCDIRRLNSIHPRGGYESDKWFLTRHLSWNLMFCFPRTELGRLNIYDLSLNVEAAGATDLRDHVYAFLGLISPEEFEIIGSDYQLSLGEVYARATYAAIRSKGAGAVHAVTTLSDRTPGLPTWAIDFSTTYALSILDTSSFNHMEGVGVIPHGLTDSLVRGGASSVDLISFQASPGCTPRLSIHACKFGDVMTASKAFGLESLFRYRLYEDPSAAKASAPKLAAEIRDSVSTLLSELLGQESPHTGAKGTHYSYASQKLADDPYRTRERALQYQEILAPALSFWELDIRTATLPNRLPLLEHMTKTDPSVIAMNAYINIADYFGYTDSFAESSSLAMLSSGFLVLAPGMIEPGDVVVIADGVKLPLLLRPHGEDWHFRGLVYVYGIDYEKLVAQWKSEGRRLSERFNVC